MAFASARNEPPWSALHRFIERSARNSVVTCESYQLLDVAILIVPEHWRLITPAPTWSDINVDARSPPIAIITIWPISVAVITVRPVSITIVWAVIATTIVSTPIAYLFDGCVSFCQRRGTFDIGPWRRLRLPQKGTGKSIGAAAREVSSLRMSFLLKVAIFIQPAIGSGSSWWRRLRRPP